MLRDFPDCIWTWNVMIWCTHHPQRRRDFEGDLRVTWKPVGEEGGKKRGFVHPRGVLLCSPIFFKFVSLFFADLTRAA